MCINKMWYSHTVEYYSASERMDLESMLSEINQRPTNIMIQTSLQRIEGTLIEAERRENGKPLSPEGRISKQEVDISGAG